MDRGAVGRTLLAGVAGAGLMYFLDPDRGKRRRNMTRDRAAAAFRRGARGAERLGRQAGVGRQSLAHRVAPARTADAGPVDDRTLEQRVESQIFRHVGVPRDRISLSVEEGVLVLRGEVDRPEQIGELEAAARKIPGVQAVENLLHLPGTPAPNRSAALGSDRVVSPGQVGGMTGEGQAGSPATR
jgi:hyperosmotically inducible periplasmic protein